MLELGISQAQSQFTKILNQTVLVVDKKSHHKKAVILPYSEYRSLLEKSKASRKEKKSSFSKFVGILDGDFETDDIRYNKIIN